MLERLNLTEQEIRELALEAQREYKREWRAKNKDKIRASNQRYWEKKALERVKQRKD